MFCTYLTIYRGPHLPPFYIGHSTEKKVQAGYRGSVCSRRYREVWKSELIHHPDRFKTIVLTLHETRQQAVDREVELQRSLNVVQNPLYANAALATGRPSLLGVKKTEQHKRNLSLSKKGKYIGRKMPERDEQWKQKQREANLGKRQSEQTRDKMRASHLGKKQSEETRAKIRAAALRRWEEARQRLT